jgi:hypothetical protein
MSLLIGCMTSQGYSSGFLACLDGGSTTTSSTTTTTVSGKAKAVVVVAINLHPELEIKFPADHDKQRSIAHQFQAKLKAQFDCCVGHTDKVSATVYFIHKHVVSRSEFLLVQLLWLIQ